MVAPADRMLVGYKWLFKVKKNSDVVLLGTKYDWWISIMLF